MERSPPGVRAGLALACALLALALPRPERAPEPCRLPLLRAAGEVVCAPASAMPPRLTGPARRLFDLPVDPNRADLLSLETLPGIGPVRARAIVAERCRRPFDSLADLERVYGLGPARVQALAPWIAFDPSMATGDAASVESHSCRSSCGAAGTGPGREAAPRTAAEIH